MYILPALPIPRTHETPFTSPRLYPFPPSQYIILYSPSYLPDLYAPFVSFAIDPLDVSTLMMSSCATNFSYIQQHPNWPI